MSVGQAIWIADYLSEGKVALGGGANPGGNVKLTPYLRRWRHGRLGLSPMLSSTAKRPFQKALTT
jgi:hypothetical protein